MRVLLLGLAVAVAVASPSAFAGDSKASKALTDAEKARIRAQVESLQKSKIDQAQKAQQDIKNNAIKKGQAVDSKLNQAKEQIDRDADGLSWVYGKNAASLAAKGKKQELKELADSEKAKIAAEAQRKAAAKAVAAKKQVESINDTVEGLKSQVGKDGKFGLQPKGSNLNVRNYGK
jgi:hypothetical protein